MYFDITGIKFAHSVYYFSYYHTTNIFSTVKFHAEFLSNCHIAVNPISKPNLIENSSRNRVEFSALPKAKITAKVNPSDEYIFQRDTFPAVYQAVKQPRKQRTFLLTFTVCRAIITSLLITALSILGGGVLANKDHSLDDKIIRAAYSEFLAYGFCKASLHKISEKAGVTTGAIYTRYKNKDALFVALLQDFFEAMKVMFAPVAKEYEKAMLSAKTEDILSAINSEEKIYFELLASHYDDCTLFFSRSDGSSVETMLNDLMEQKTQQTVDFFFRVYGKKPNADAIRLIMGSQFWNFRQLLDKHPDEDRMFACLRSILDFTNAGWRQLCLTLQ